MPTNPLLNTKNDADTFSEELGMIFHIKGHSKPMFLADPAFIDFKTMQPVSRKRNAGGNLSAFTGHKNRCS